MWALQDFEEAPAKENERVVKRLSSRRQCKLAKKMKKGRNVHEIKMAHSPLHVRIKNRNAEGTHSIAEHHENTAPGWKARESSGFFQVSPWKSLESFGEFPELLRVHANSSVRNRRHYQC